MGFDMTNTGGNSNGGEFKGPRLIPANVPVKAGQHLAKFCTYVELGEHSQATDKYPDKGCAPMAKIEWEFPALEHVFDPDKGAQPLREGRVLPLYANEKANSYKFFMALRNCIHEGAARMTGQNPIPADVAGNLPSYGDKGASSFDQMLGASCIVVVTHTKSTKTYKNSLPVGTTLEQVKAAKDSGHPIQPVAVQQVPWTYANIAPHSIQSTLNPAFGAALVDLHPNSSGLIKFLWDSPTAEDWAKLYPWMRDKIKKAVNYPGSAVEAMVLSLEQAERNNTTAPTESADEDLGPAFPSEASGMDDIPF